VDSVVQIIGLAARFLTAAGVPAVAIYGACVLLAVIYILAPKAWASLAAAAAGWKFEAAPDPLSDGETAEDRKLRHVYEVTDPLRKLPPTRDEGNSEGNG
jgi:hypothetical protein